VTEQLTLTLPPPASPPPAPLSSPPLPEDRSYAALVNLLSHAQGEAAAMTLAQLAARLQIPRRKVEILIELHRGDLPFPLVASSAGLFVPTTPAEGSHYLAACRSRIVCLALNIRSTRRQLRLAGLLPPA
jgi:CRP-like cAMP-binding protein